MSEKVYTDDLANASQSEFSGGQLVSPSFTLELKHKLEITPGKPVGTFTVAPGTPEAGVAANFEAKVSDPNGTEGQPLKYTWNFGDGTTSGPSTSANTTHTFSKAESVTVKLTVEDKLGKSEVFTKTVTVKPNETAKKKRSKRKEGKRRKRTERKTETERKTRTERKAGTEGKRRSRTARGEGGNEGGKGNGNGGGPGNNGVLSYSASFSPSSTVSKSGTVSVTINCSGQSSCAGTIVLKSVKAYATKKGKHKSIVTLGSAELQSRGRRQGRGDPTPLLDREGATGEVSPADHREP